MNGKIEMIKQEVKKSLNNTEPEHADPLTVEELHRELQGFGFATSKEKCRGLLKDLVDEGVLVRTSEGVFVLEESELEE